MPVEEIKREIICRVGGVSGDFLVGHSVDVAREIIALASKKLGITPEELHGLTCFIREDVGVTSITGDKYLASKVLKIKFAVRVEVEDCELIDDVNVSKQQQ